MAIFNFVPLCWLISIEASLKYVWLTGGCHDKAREGNCIGFLDSGIYPYHPSFATHEAEAEPYGLVPNYRGKCEVDLETKRSFCNGKIIGAQHFAKAAIAFNPSADYASPLDGDEHGSNPHSYVNF